MKTLTLVPLSCLFVVCIATATALGASVLL
jgi:hypothetical protein